MKDWIVEDSEGELLAMDLTKDEATEIARRIIDDEPVSTQNLATGEEIIYLPNGEIEHHKE